MCAKLESNLDGSIGRATRGDLHVNRNKRLTTTVAIVALTVCWTTNVTNPFGINTGGAISRPSSMDTSAAELLAQCVATREMDLAVPCTSMTNASLNGSWERRRIRRPWGESISRFPGFNHARRVKTAAGRIWDCCQCSSRIKLPRVERTSNCLF